MPTVYETLREAGCEIDSHELDLYVKATSEALKIVRASGHSFSTFAHQVSSECWLDVPFAYDPFWKAREGR